MSSEIQAAELRARARRRLAGAVILVLAAVIILPMVLDSRPTQVADNVSVRIPSKDAPYQPAVSDPQAQQATQAATLPPAATQPSAPAAASTTGPVATHTPPIPEAPAMADLERSLAKQEKQEKQEEKTEPAPAETRPSETKPAETKSPETRPAPVVRTDNGAVAMALLEGRKPPTAAPNKPASGGHGNYVLQIAAYSVQADAQSRYAKLRQSGITDAYIEPYTTSSGKTQYRLRVGPFPSREAAQATQARLRALGFDNGFIAAK